MKDDKKRDEIPDVGPALATALVAGVADPSAFRPGRDFSAWLGLAPKQHSSKGKEKTGNISKRGDHYLARPVHCRCAGRDPPRQEVWRQALALAHHVVGAAANEDRRGCARQQDAKTMMGRGERYKEPIALAT
jgi:transposase